MVHGYANVIVCKKFKSHLFAMGFDDIAYFEIILCFDELIYVGVNWFYCVLVFSFYPFKSINDVIYLFRIAQQWLHKWCRIDILSIPAWTYQNSSTNWNWICQILTCLSSIKISCNCANEMICLLGSSNPVAYTTWDCWRLGSHGEVHGAGNIQVSTSRTGGSLLSPGRWFVFMLFMLYIFQLCKLA